MMKEWLLEIIIVIAYSGRTQAALVLGVVFCVGIGWYGDYTLSNVEFVGSIRGVEASIKEIFAQRYEQVALGALLSFWTLAYKWYQKDKKKLF